MVLLETLQGTSLPGTLTSEWKALLRRSAIKNPYLTPLWTQIWLKHSGGALDPKFLRIRSAGGELIGLGAFRERRSEEDVRGLDLLGSEDVWDYRDLVMAAGREEEVSAEFATYFAAGPWNFIELSSISEFSPTRGRLLPFLRQNGFRVSEEEMEPCLYLHLPPSWDEFLERLNPKDRHELRRKLRRLGRDSSFQIEDSVSSAAPENMERFFTLHTLSKSEKAEFMTEEMKAYFRDLAARFEEKNWLDLSFLKIENRDAAAALSFIFEGTEYLYNSGYDPQFGRFSPGIIIVAERIRRAIEHGEKNFNFLKGREDYKFRLGGREEKLYRMRITKP